MSDRHYRVLTAVGHDRPGLVDRLSNFLLEAGVNLEDSRMAILGGEFALILLFSGPQTAVDQVSALSPQLEAQLGLNISIQATARQTASSDYLPYSLRVSGIDRPGIVARVSTLLAGREINVAALDSRLTYAPLSGTPLFQLQAQLQVPSKTGLSELRQKLGQMCEDENLDYILESMR